MSFRNEILSYVFWVKAKCILILQGKNIEQPKRRLQKLAIGKGEYLMFENGINYVTELLGVSHLKWGESNVKVLGRDYSALAFRIKGEANVKASGKQHNIGANDILYMPQNVSYIAEYSDTEILVIHFKTACDDRSAEVYSANNSERMYHDFLKMQILWEKKEPGYQGEILSVLYGVLAEISRKKSATALRADFLKGISFINENFKDSTLSVPQVCREAGICETSFRKSMKVYCGKTPIEYLTELRLEYARSLIACGTSVKQSALESGFSDPKYFSRIVKKYFGCRAVELKNFGK